MTPVVYRSGTGETAMYHTRHLWCWSGLVPNSYTPCTQMVWYQTGHDPG